MRGLILAILAAACLIVHAQADCTFKGKTYPPGKFDVDCNLYTCHEDGSLSGVTCPEMRCLKQIGYQDTDLSKPYPDCCPRPICES